MKNFTFILLRTVYAESDSLYVLFVRQSVNHVSAVADGTQWTDFAASSFEGGEGTAESPYLIKTPEHLAKLAKDVYDGTSVYENTYFKLVADIDLAGHDWFPIGYNCSVGEENVRVAFSGKVDGDGHKITNLTIPGLTDYKSMGMFGCTDPGFGVEKPDN